MSHALAFFGIVGTRTYKSGATTYRAEIRKQRNGRYAFEVFSIDGPGFGDVSLCSSLKDLSRAAAVRLLKQTPASSR